MLPKKVIEKEFIKEQKIKSSNKEITEELVREQSRNQQLLDNLMASFNEKKKRHNESKSKADELLGKIEVAGKIRDIKKEIDLLESRIKEKIEVHDKEKIKYHSRLFTDSWLLKNTQEFFSKYSDKFSTYEKQRISEEANIEAKEQVKQELKKKIRLPVNVPEPHYLEWMIEKERCLVCDRKAEAGSEPYNKIAELLNLSKNETPTVKSIFKNNHVNELKKLLHNGLSLSNDIKNVDSRIIHILEHSNKLTEEISLLKNKLNLKNDEYEHLKRATLLSDRVAHDIINEYSIADRRSHEFKKECDDLDDRIKNVQSELDRIESRLNDLSSNFIDKSLVLKKEMISDLAAAAISTRSKVFNDLIKRLEEEANKHYSEMTKNIHSFRGEIRLKLTDSGDYMPEVITSDGRIIVGLNTGNLLLVKLSVVMAIISAKKITHNYVLITDAPTSVFGEELTLGFCKTVSKVYKQSIILTKDFYNNKNLLDAINNDNNVNLGHIYEIEPNNVNTDRNKRSDLVIHVNKII
jgi:DNA sulfur modification protein DndD